MERSLLLQLRHLRVRLSLRRQAPKKWKYPSTLRLTDRYIDRHRKGVDPYADYRYADKGSWILHISLPYANAFYSAYGKESQWGAGFLGLSLGLSYHTSDKTFVNLSAAGILDSEIPIPAAIDYESPQVKDHRYSILANLSNNHLLLQKRLSLGYGLSYGYDTWNTIHHGIAQEGEKQENIRRTSHSLGFVFPVYYYTRRSFYLGIVPCSCSSRTGRISSTSTPSVSTSDGASG